MGQLTNDLTRLRREVEALRDARGALMNNLTREAGDLTRAVAALRRETADDLRGARLAWRGEGPGKSRPVPKKEEKRAVAASEAPIVENHKSKARPSVSASLPFQKHKEKSSGVKSPPKR